MSLLGLVVGGTAVAHVLLMAAVFAHSRRTNRDPGYWLPATLLFGIMGVAGYLWTG
mgnify:CR=1 FL=1